MVLGRGDVVTTNRIVTVVGLGSGCGDVSTAYGRARRPVMGWSVVSAVSSVLLRRFPGPAKDQTAQWSQLNHEVSRGKRYLELGTWYLVWNLSLAMYQGPDTKYCFSDSS